MKICFYAGTEGNTNYSKQCKELKNSLINKGVEIIEEEIYTPALMISTPEMWCRYSGNRHKPFITYIVFRGNKFLNYWVECCNQDYITHIIVHDKYIKETLLKNGVKKPISIIPINNYENASKKIVQLFKKYLVNET